MLAVAGRDGAIGATHRACGGVRGVCLADFEHDAWDALRFAGTEVDGQSGDGVTNQTDVPVVPRARTAGRTNVDSGEVRGHLTGAA